MALICAMLCFSVASKAQNLQVLYDTDHECVTSTLEFSDYRRLGNKPP